MRLASRTTVLVLAGILAGCSVAAPGPTPTPTPSPRATASEEPDVDTPDESEPAPSDVPSTTPSQQAPSEGPEGVTGSWTGAWHNDPEWGTAHGGFTITVVQHGGAFDGTIDVTGPTCVGHGTVSGTVTGRAVTMGLVIGGRNVDYLGTLDGNAMSGTWTTIACGTTQQISGTWSAQRN
jgi:hypothetical protein